jgi:hypothetical protein
MTATVHYLSWSAAANGVLDAAAQLDATDAIAFCELAVSYLEANASELDDPTPLIRLAERLGEITAGARAARAAGPAWRHPARPRPRAR